MQDCVKAQRNAAYANKVKLSNLKEMAKTVAYIQEHGYDTRDALEDSFAEIKNQASSSRKNLKSIEDRLRATNEQIHYTGQYLANKFVYREFCSAKNNGQFRKEHVAEITLYETVRKFLTEHSVDGKMPSMKQLKSEKEQLLQQKERAALKIISLYIRNDVSAYTLRRLVYLFPFLLQIFFHFFLGRFCRLKRKISRLLLFLPERVWENI